MRKQIHPAAAAGTVIVAMLIALFLFYKQTEPPPVMPMSPLGPAAHYMALHPHDTMLDHMTPEEKRMVHTVTGQTVGVSKGPAGLPAIH